MASAAAPDPVREYQLIEKLELRIAGAKNDEQFEDIIQKFLPALILKLASETERNRNLTIKVCQYVSQRLKISQTIQLPLPGLFKNLQSTENAFVRRFSMVFIQQGLTRVNSARASDLLSEILKFAIPVGPSIDSTAQKLWSIAFDFTLDALCGWRAPERKSKEDEALKEHYDLSEAQCDVLSSHVSRFLLFDPKISSTSQGLDDDFRAVFEKHYRQRTIVVPPAADFLFSAIFTDSQRLIPATIMSVDANAAAAGRADVMFKQCNFEFESDESVEALFELYQYAKPKLQARVISLLSRSQKSTEKTSRIYSIVERQLNSQDTGLEASKLRAAIFAYLNWAVRVGSCMGSIAQQIQTLLKDYIEQQGWPSPRDRTPAEAELRAKAYESIGLLAGLKHGSAEDQAQAADIDLITWLFTSLRCDETKEIRGSIEEALSRMMNAAPADDKEIIPRLRDLLLWNVMAEKGDEDPLYYFATVNSTRYTAVRFANKCLPFHDPTARLIDILAIGNAERKELTDEGERGLDPYWHRSNQRLTTDVARRALLPYPAFDDVVARFFNGPEAGKITGSPTSLSHALVFCRNLLVMEALRDSPDQVDEVADWTSQIEALVQNSATARRAISKYMDTASVTILAGYLTLTMHGEGLKLDRQAEVAVQLLSLSNDGLLEQVRPAVSDFLYRAVLLSSSQYSAARCLGILESVQGSVQSATSELDKCVDWKSAIGAQAVQVRGHLLAATYIATRLSLRQVSTSMSETLSSLNTLLNAMVMQSTDQSIRNTAIVCLGQLGLCVPPNDKLDPGSQDVIDVLIKECKKQGQQAATALGRIACYRAGLGEPSAVHALIDRMFALHEVKQAEFHFALGEALSVAISGFQSSSTMTELDVRADIPSWGPHPELQEHVVVKVFENCETTKPTLKKAAAIWLLSLVQYCGDLPAINSRLQDCQKAFARLLTDRDEITQEAGSRGLGIVYEKGDKQLRDDLVRDLVQSFTGSGAKLSGTVTEDTQLFDTGTLPTEGGQSVSTYKDIVSLATEMGDPSLVYKFMNLASSNAIWTSRAAFGKFGLSNVLADSAYLAENKKFYPKLFRYRFDPNPNVQRSMNEIWRALVKDPTTVIDQNFGLIMEDLLKSVLSGKEWRTREASCAAIADLVSGRDIEKLEGYLDEIWKVAFRVLDDVKETVRVAAMKLCRTLTNMLVRNLEAGQGNTKRATTLLNHAMPFLLKQMEGGQAQEVQQYATITLLEVVKKSPPRSLQPFAAVILETLVNSLSTLEHESINYLHLNADKYGLTAEKLDKMRVSSVNASPVTEAIDRCLESLTMNTTASETNVDAMDGVEATNKTPLQDAMNRLEASFKSAIGLPSRVGLSRVMVTLVVRHPTAFRPFADQFARLHRKHVLDRNATISVAFSTSLGYLLRIVSEKEVQATSKYAQKLYFDSQELSHRAVAGEILQSISKTSNDVFVNYASTFLPFAFVGRNDTDEEVRERFDPPWKDNIGGSRAVQLYLQEIADLITIYVKSPLWPIRHACCFAVAELVTSLAAHGKYSAPEASVLWPLMEEALNGKTWEGKEKIISAYPKFVEHVPAGWIDGKVGEQMVKIAIREAKRQNAAYRPHAIQALGDFAKIRADVSLSPQVVPFLQELVEELTNEDAMDVDGEDQRARYVMARTRLYLLLTEEQKQSR